MADRRNGEDPALVRQDQALSSYLEDLLSAIPEGDEEASGREEAPEPEPAPHPPRPVLDTPARPVTHLPTVAPPEPVEPAVKPAPAEAPPAETPEESPPAAVPAVDTPSVAARRAPAPEPEPEGPHDPIPEWARPDFQALIFYVGGLRLAVPLVKLNSVVPYPRKVAPTPGKPDWFRGLFHYRGRNVKVVDTATLVLDRHRNRLSDEDLSPRKLLVVGDSEWALACRDVGEVMRLKPDQVQWRTSRGQRRWLAGTVREHLCALMDTDAFAELLEEHRT